MDRINKLSELLKSFRISPIRLISPFTESLPITEPVFDLDEIKRRQRYAESAFNDSAKSRVGATGAYQIMPITYKDYLLRGKGKEGDLLDPVYNEKVRDFVLGIIPRDLGDTWSDIDSEKVRLAKQYAAYNWGAGSLKKYLRNQRDSGIDISGLDWLNGLPKETRDYVNFVVFGKDVPNTGKTMDLYNAAKQKHNILEDGGILFGKSGIHIKKANRGKFTDYCGGKVTEECIRRGKNSSNPAVRKRATFAANVRRWHHKDGGIIKPLIQWDL